MYRPSPFRYHLFSIYLLAALLCLFSLLTSCQKDNGNYVVTPSGDIVDVEAVTTTPNETLIAVCHHDAETNSYERIEVTEKDWGHHVRHGDVRLDDQDKDGFIAFNHCDADMGTYVFDCDDTDATRHPANAEQCDRIDRDCSGDPVNRTTQVFAANGSTFVSGTAVFGPAVATVSATWVAPTDAISCQKFTDTQSIKGRIALIDPKADAGSASCPDYEANFYFRLTLKAQQAGAIGVIYCSTDTDTPIGRLPKGKDPVRIPVGTLSRQDCARLQAQAPTELSIYTRSVCGVPAVPK